MGCAKSSASTPIHSTSSPGGKENESKRFIAFLSHDWADDELGRNNHQRVQKIFKALGKRGLSLWFDEVYMKGDIDETMCKGIDESELVCLFITKRYMSKVTGDNPNDNCKKEFNFAKHKGADKMICIVMEPQCRDTSKWPGQVQIDVLR